MPRIHRATRSHHPPDRRLAIIVHHARLEEAPNKCSFPLIPLMARYRTTNGIKYFSVCPEASTSSARSRLHVSKPVLSQPKEAPQALFRASLQRHSRHNQMMQKFCRYLCCCLSLAAILTLAGPPVPVHAGTTSKQQAATQKKLAAVKKRIADLARQQRETAGKRHAIDAALAAQADKLSAASRAVRDSDQAITDNQHALDALEKQRDTLKSGLDSQRDALADLLRAAYKIRPGSDLRLLLGDADVAQLARVLAYSRYFQHDRVRHIRDLLKQLDDLNRVEADITRKRQVLEAAHAQKKAHMEALADARKQQQALLAKVTAQLKGQHQQMRQLERNQKSLKALLEKLRDVFADIPDKLPADMPFAKRRGKLPWPVHGNASAHDDGIQINTRRGATVRAVAHGRIAYANWLRGYGLLVVIDHGNGWMSLYGGNESVLHGVGDWVNAGDPIATAGASVGDDAGVYFGLRHHGKAVKPLAWLSKHR